MEIDLSYANPLYWIGIYLAFDFIRFVVKYFIKNIRHNKLVLKAQRIRQDRDRHIQQFLIDHNSLVPSKHLQEKIVERKSLAELQAGLEAGEFSSVDLLMFYVQRCSTYGIQLNLLTDITFDSALVSARKCDEIRKDPAKMEDIKRTTESGGLLFGIPVSVKDSLLLKETHSTLGCINLADWTYEKEGVLDKIIQQNGGIVFAKTNVPQMLLSMDTSNRLYGNSKNPINHDRVAGGSSGGCAALVACQGTSLSFCGDIGGSIRGPASFCGVYGFKPSVYRISNRIVSIFKDICTRGLEQIITVAGPITQNINDSILITKLMINSTFVQNQENAEYCEANSSNESTLVPLKFDNEEFEKYATKKQLKIGYYTNLFSMECSKP